MNFGDERIPRRIWSKIQELPSGCWRWGGCVASVPQTRWKVGDRWITIAVRRVFAELEAGGPLEPHRGIAALCSKNCVRPDHYTIAPLPDIARKWSAMQPERTTCKHGHVLAVVGIYVKPLGYPKCRQCHSLRLSEQDAKRRVRRLRRMSPERRARFLARSEQQTRLWRSGRIRRRDGSLCVPAQEATRAVPQ